MKFKWLVSLSAMTNKSLTVDEKSLADARTLERKNNTDALAESSKDVDNIRTIKAPPIDPYALSQAILDPTNLKILAKLTRKPMTAKELVKAVGIPYTTCYRRLKWLVENGLCNVNTNRTNGSNLAYKVYSAEIESLTLHFDDEEFDLVLRLRSIPSKNHTYHQWLG